MSKLLIGTVVSTKMQKTIVVVVSRKVRHPMYRKVVTISKRYKVHSEDSTIKEGDIVTIRETRPISKDKHFILMHKGEATKQEIKTENTQAVAIEATPEKKTAVSSTEAEIKVKKVKEVLKKKPTVKSVVKKSQVK